MADVFTPNWKFEGYRCHFSAPITDFDQQHPSIVMFKFSTMFSFILSCFRPDPKSTYGSKFVESFTVEFYENKRIMDEATAEKNRIRIEEQRVQAEADRAAGVPPPLTEMQIILVEAKRAVLRDQDIKIRRFELDFPEVPSFRRH